MSDLIHVETVGSGEPLVLVHGDFANGLMAWAKQIETLARVHRLVVVDRRGHGFSPRNPPYTIDRDAFDVLAAVDSVGAESFHLVGHSYGGMVAMAMARQNPSRVASLHVIEPPYMALLPDDPDVVDLTRRAGEVFRRAAEWGPERATTEFFRALVGAENLASMQSRPAWSLLVRESERIASAQFPGDYGASLVQGFRLDVPVVIYTGERSHPGLRKIAAALSQAIPGASLVDVPDAAHDVQRSVDAFNRALLSVTQVQGA